MLHFCPSVLSEYLTYFIDLIASQQGLGPILYGSTVASAQMELNILTLLKHLAARVHFHTREGEKSHPGVNSTKKKDSELNFATGYSSLCTC